MLASGLADFIIQDLAASGLTPEDMHIRSLENAERAATATPFSTPGYVIPYFNAEGRPVPFYRCRLLDSDAKYRQPKDSPNHVYFPKNFHTIAYASHPITPYIVITEGEKKAAAAVKAGFPCVGLGGVYSWKNRTILIAGDAALSTHRSKLAVRLPAGDEITEDYNTPLAVGFIDLIDKAASSNPATHIIICFDSDNSTAPTTPRTTNEVQRAAADLAYELRFRGIQFSHIHQLILPPIIDFEFQGDKVGLDDFLASRSDDCGPKKLERLIQNVLTQRGTFPRHPNIRDYINKRLQNSNMSRKETQGVALAILSELDGQGRRLRAPTNETFYFDHNSKRLLLSAWGTYSDPQLDSPFTQFLYQQYGLSAADRKLLVWLGTQFTGEQPIEEVSPYRVFARPNSNTNPTEKQDVIYYQISDSEFVELTAQSFKIHNNGDLNVLFVADQVEPLDKSKLLQEFQRQSKDADSNSSSITCWWANTLAQVRLRDKDKQRISAALLYYLSPWLFRWRGMQLPIELIVGEAGSGKSTLCELRLDILTGRPLLRNTPTDLKDWHASVTNAGGLHVSDNVQLTDRTLRQRLSDELCRITTESDPYIEQRKYYTNADLIRIPVRTTFALTAIQQPFQNADLLQRSMILELDKSIDANRAGEIRYDSNWKQKQLQNRGGREAWVAHHLVVLQRFFQLVQQKWDPNYIAKQRLINFEQSLLLMAEVFGIPANWLPDFLVGSSDQAVSEADWILEGLHAFALEHNRPSIAQKRFQASMISEWSESQSEYKGCEPLVNPRKLGKYLRAHKSAVFHLTGIVEAGMESNRVCYRFQGKPLERR
jgi:Domain of unknown function (DUF3854)